MKQAIAIALVAIAVSMAVPAATTQRPNTARRSIFELGDQHLVSTGYHLAATISFQEQMRLQTLAPKHQVVRVRWDSLPGLPHDRLLTGDEVRDASLSRLFVLRSRRHNLPGAPGSIHFSLDRDTIVVIAATTSGEIRSLDVIPDYRIQGGEGHVFVKAEIEFDINLIDDPQISQIAFFKPELRGNHFDLQSVGSLKLSDIGP